MDPSELEGIIGFVTPARFDLITAAGGDSGWNQGVDYQRLFAKSPYRGMVEALYRGRADLHKITETADIALDETAVHSMLSHSQPDGSLQMPVMSMHTTYDPRPSTRRSTPMTCAPRGIAVCSVRYSSIATGHCKFTPAELIAGIRVLEERVETGRWSAASVNAGKLNQLASSFGLGESASVHFGPGVLIGDRSDLFQL